jgi:hypothetical protein
MTEEQYESLVRLRDSLDENCDPMGPTICDIVEQVDALRATLSRVTEGRDALANDPIIQNLLRCRSSGASFFLNVEFEGVEFVDGSDGKRTKVQPYTPGNPNPTRNPGLCTQFTHEPH